MPSPFLWMRRCTAGAVLFPLALLACPHPINNPADPDQPIANQADEVKPGQTTPEPEPEVEPLIDPEGDVQPRPQSDPNEGPGAGTFVPPHQPESDEDSESFMPEVHRSPPAVETDNPPLSV